MTTDRDRTETTWWVASAPPGVGGAGTMAIGDGQFLGVWTPRRAKRAIRDAYTETEYDRTNAVRQA